MTARTVLDQQRQFYRRLKPLVDALNRLNAVQASRLFNLAEGLTAAESEK